MTAQPQRGILPHVRGTWRRPAALLVLGAALSPWLAAGAVALHAEDHSARHEERGDDDMAVALHGHHHETGTPVHQHVLTLPMAAPAPVKASLAPLPAALARMVAEATVVLVKLAVPVGAAAHDPPSVPRSFSILRI